MTETSENTSAPAALNVEKPHAGELRFVLTGRLDSQTTGALWTQCMETLDRERPERLVVDASGVDYCDGAGTGLLLGLSVRQRGADAGFEVEGLRDEFQQLMTMLDPGAEPFVRPRHPSVRQATEEVGRATVRMWHDFQLQIAFVGECAAALFYLVRHPRRMRWKDAFLVAEDAGVHAVSIVATVGFLMGLILAFQSAIPLRKFGTEIFVADLVALSMLRELGPLMTAVLLAGRTGSAFAAELGTMKVNEELDALTTMGLDPVRFLVGTRVAAAVIVTPILTIFANLAGLVGAGVVIVSMGYPLTTYLDHVQNAVGLGDAASGLVKSVVFGLLVGGVGCLRGLQTEAGARAVGVSATRAVVRGIFLIVIADGIFAVMYYFLGI